MVKEPQKKQHAREASSNHSLTTKISAVLSYIGSCSKVKLFVVLLVSRLPILIFIGCIWDLAVEDYDTSTMLMPTSLAWDPYEGLQSVKAQIGHSNFTFVNANVLTLQEEGYLGPATPTTNSNFFWRGETFRSLRALRHWDVLHFNHIAVHGYTHEHLHAFFPGVPYLLRVWGWVATWADEQFLEPTLQVMTNGSQADRAIMLRNAARYLLEDFGAVALSVGAFAAAGVVLRSLTALHLEEEGSDLKVVLEGRRLSEGQQGTPLNRPTILGILLVIYVTMPAGVFTLVPYTESLFALLIFLGIYAFKKASLMSDAVAEADIVEWRKTRDQTTTDKDTFPLPPVRSNRNKRIAKSIQRRFAIAAFFFMLATAVRSNGFLMVGYFLHELFLHRWRLHVKLTSIGALTPLQNPVHENGLEGAKNNKKDSISIPIHSSLLSGGLSVVHRAIITAACIFIAAVPYGLVNYIAWNNFCGGERAKGSMALGDFSSHHPIPPPSSHASELPHHCPANWWQFYGYVQRKYWNVYPFSAYTIKNLPNFIIPAPLVAFVVLGLAKYWRRTPQETDAKIPSPMVNRAVSILLNPHIMCLIFMIAFASCMMHIQVMVRFVFASPAYYWISTAIVLKGSRMVGNSYLVWSIAWLAAGCITFTNHYPWT